MSLNGYRKFVYYLKGPGVCVVVVGSCWCLYHLRQSSHLLRSVVAKNLLDIEQTHAQYIYIDDPRFKDESMFREEKDLPLNSIERKRSISETIEKWWKSLNNSLAYKLLHMAQYGDTSERLKAVYTLNSLKYLKDWHCRQIAQTLDARTAVALARMPDVDTRFFLRPPYDHVQHKLFDVIETVHSLLLTLSSRCDKPHPCLLGFVNKKFGDSLRDGPLFEHDLASLGLAAPPTTIWNKDLLLGCVQALCHHSCDDKYSKDIIDAGGLPILMMIKKIFSDNTDVYILLAKIISNVSLHTEYLNDIFRSGWIGTLVEWSKSTDIRLSAPAGRALANLDMDENVKYPRRIYLLHPLYKLRSSPKLDVVFLHGLLGGVFITWRQRDLDSTARVVEPRTEVSRTDSVATMLGEHAPEFLTDIARDLQKLEWNRTGQDFEIVLDDCPLNVDCESSGPYFCSGDDPCVRKFVRDNSCRTQCWPKDWLPEDVPFLRIIGVNYDTNLSMWTPMCPIDNVRTTLADRSGEYKRKLLAAGVGRRPVVWVCHSMGGLLVKRMLIDEWKHGDPHGICKNTRAIIFYSTPHRGSRVASLRQTTEMLLWPSVEVQELREESPNLLQLHQQFVDFLKVYPVEVVSFSETKSTLVTALKFRFQFVTPDSADPGVGEFFEIPQDHLSICKPANRQSFLYQKLVTVLKRHVTPPGERKLSPIMELLSLSSKLS